MKMNCFLILGLALTCVAARVATAQLASATPPMYVNENGTDPAPLKLDGLTGRVQGLGGDGMPMVTVGVFTEQGHQLVTSAASDREGKFKFEKLSHGLYRVVVRVAGLCPANIPVKVEGSPLAHHKLVITMRPKDIDTCSYGTTK